MRADAVIVDAGPLVAFLSAADKHHAWAVEYLSACEMPLLTCEAVLSEVFFHLRKNAAGLALLVEMIEGDAFQIVPVYNLVGVSRYAVRHRVDFADACLALLSEKFPRSRIATVDRRDFARLLRYGDEPIPFDAP
jgi:predicted nucleic acid-binding protein